jgi:hypothetical protein
MLLERIETEANGPHLPHSLAVFALDMSMQIWPAETGHIAISIRTIVSQEDDGIFKDIFIFIFDPQIVVCSVQLRVLKVFVALRGIVREDHETRLTLHMQIG